MTLSTTLSQSLQHSLNKLFDFLPQLIASIVILLIGYLIAKLVQAAVRRALRHLRFDHAMHSSPAGKYIVRFVESPSALAGRIGFWVIFLIFISFAISTLNLQLLDLLIAGIYAYIPRVIAAIIIFLIASAISAGGAAFVQGLLGRTPLARIIATIIPAVTLSIATFMILDQLRIAPNIVMITYAAIMGSLALGLALAFGLGGRDLARDMLEQAYAASQRGAENVRAEMGHNRTATRRQPDQGKEGAS